MSERKKERSILDEESMLTPPSRSDQMKYWGAALFQASLVLGTVLGALEIGKNLTPVLRDSGLSGEKLVAATTSVAIATIVGVIIRRRINSIINYP